MCTAVKKKSSTNADVRTAVNEFVKDAEQFDDLTMLCLDYHPSGKSK